ncbi:WG repeat-containing protein [Paenibacillus sp. sgz500958]|uniref:WG repeat-containing protein n=1 Tax=Paenibacillus sp. sgz500958 TaxID=3242475 RepID=UPI0036D41E43
MDKNKLAAILFTGLLALIAFFSFGGTRAHADRWEIFDQGDHLFLPEGPVEVDGVVMVPLRPIAERFGYTFESVTSSEVILKDQDGYKLTIKLGTKRALLDDPTGMHVQLMEQIPRYYNGSLFIDLALAGAMGGQGHSVVPGTNLIQLRPVSGDAKEKLDSLYWYSFNDNGGTVAVDNQGREQLKTSYTGVLDFGYEELIPVKKSGYTAGFMNRAGELAVDAPHYQLGQFSEGLATFKDLVKTESGGITVKMGYMNRTGRIVIPAIYNRAYDFADGMAKVLSGGKTYYIDHNGKTAIPVIFGSQSTDSFSEGLAAVSVRTTNGGKSVFKTGYIDTKGKWVIKPVYDYASPFRDGVAVIVNNGKTGLINQKGVWIFKPQSTESIQFIGYFNDGYIMLSQRHPYDYTQRLVDTKGKLIAIPGADHLISYGEGMVAYEEGPVGFKTLAGQTMVKPIYSFVSTFQGGAAKAYVNNANNTYTPYLINKAGEVVWTGE